MHPLTELYFEVRDGKKQTSTRATLVNPAQVTFVRDYGTMRRVYFPGSDYVEVEESLEHLAAYLVPVEAVRR